jgi:hypothetical protein
MLRPESKKLRNDPDTDKQDASMEVPGQRAQSFEVIAFGPGGKRVFARH